MNRQERRKIARAKAEFVARMKWAKEQKKIERLLPRLTVKVPPLFPTESDLALVARWKAKQAQRVQHHNR